MAFTLTQTPPGPYPIGPNAVTLTITDSYGASNSCSTLVIVKDTTPPQTICPADITVEFTGANGAAVSFAPTASDTCSGPPGILTMPASGSTFPIGITTIACGAMDLAANFASCRLQVTVLGPRGVLENLLAELRACRSGQPNAAPDQAHKLDDAMTNLSAALSSADWIDETHLQADSASSVMNQLKLTVNKLEELMASKHPLAPAATLQRFIDRMVKSAQLLATINSP